MEEKKFEWFMGDKILWILVIIISLASVLLVYSASAQLEYNTPNGGTIAGSITKHIGIMLFGLAVMRGVNMVKYQYVGKLSKVFLIISLVAVIYAAAKGTSIGGASASRWISIGGISVQPSNFVYLALIIHLCRYLTKSITQKRKNWENIMYVLVPIALVFVTVAKDNGSMAILIMAASIAVLILGKFGWRYIVGFLSLAFVGVALVVALAKNTNILDGTRVPTWISRVETHFKPTSEIETEADRDKKYQTNMAKSAIVNGGFLGEGMGKGVLKNQIPQSVSDFVFAVVVEEYGLLGAFLLLFLYFVVIMRIILIAHKITDVFGVLLVVSIAIMFAVQIIVNVAVAVDLIPVTGQPLPLISAGGTSMLVTYIQLGLVLNVSSQSLLRDEEGLGRKPSIEEINDIA